MSDRSVRILKKDASYSSRRPSILAESSSSSLSIASISLSVFLYSGRMSA
ncbi:MAG: hypothetical protein ACP5PL_06290 [Infirmifilum sp.]